MTHSVDTNFLSHLCHCPKSSEQSLRWSWWQGWRWCMNSATWTSDHQVWLVYNHSWVSTQPSTQRPTLSPCMVTFPGVISHLPGGVGYILPLPFFSMQCIYPTTINELTECLIHHHGFQQIVVSDQESHFTAKDNGSGLILMEFTDITMFPSNKGNKDKLNTKHSEVINMKNYKDPRDIEATLLFTHSVVSESFATL